MKAPISDRLFIDCLQCRHKAYLTITGKVGSKNDYQKYIERRDEKYRKHARAYYQQSRNITPTQSAASSFSEVKKKLLVATDITIASDRFNATLDAIEFSTRSAPCLSYIPILFLSSSKITRNDKLLLAFQSIVLNREQKSEANCGIIIHGDRYLSSKVQLSPLFKIVHKIDNELVKMAESGTMPPLRLNEHCKECEFQASCFARAKDKDDLSLLKGLSGKEIDALNKKGIFTVEQYSYTFRPRRARRLQAKMIVKHYHALNALAIRTQTIYIADKKDMPSAKVNVYFDVEGTPDDNGYYLIGLLIDDGSGITTHSLWADCKSDEKVIWDSFLSIIGKYDDYVLFHYGNYESKFVRHMTARYGGDPILLESIRARLFNVLAAIYGHVYFPTYSNELKSIATFVGYRWADAEMSGVQSIVCRNTWERKKHSKLEQRLIRYNEDDCMALRTVHRACEGLNDTDKDKSYPAKPIDEIKPNKPLGIFKRNQFIYPEMDAINKKAYWDYQQARVYVRSRTRSRSASRKSLPQIKKVYRINRTITPARPKRCPMCNARKPMKHTHHTRIIYDLKLFNGGIKRWVEKNELTRYMCKKCLKTFTPADSGLHSASKYGSTLVAWVVYQSVARLKSQSTIIDDLLEAFDYRLSPSIIANFKEQIAKDYTEMSEELLHGVIGSALLHIDETRVSIKGANGYVWAFANLDHIVYLFNSSRETNMVKEKLNAFKGVLVSDIYTGYDSVDCPQQKCLIHLIRDVNDDILKYPFDEEMKSIGRTLTMALTPIVETIDRYGLKRRYLSKHKGDIRQFLDDVLKKEYSSEAAQNYQSRFAKYREKLFTFLDYDGVPWNNNNAEHAIKRFVQLRKVIGGSSTEKGIKEYLVLLSICETLRLRNMSFLRFLMSGAKSIKEYELQQKKAA